MASWILTFAVYSCVLILFCVSESGTAECHKGSRFKRTSTRSPPRNTTDGERKKATTKSTAFNGSREPILAIISCRHGMRAPKHQPYEKNKCSVAEHWQEGWGELLKKGMTQCYEVGKALRERYGKKFVGEKFDRLQTYVRSTEVDRTIQSALALMSGFYEPNAEHRFNSSLNWFPVPVHTGGVNQPDPLLKPADYDCPKFERSKKAIQEELEIDLKKEYANVFEYLKENIGANNGNLKQLRKLNDVAREKDIGLEKEIDKWMTKKLWREGDEGVIVKDEKTSDKKLLKSTLELARAVHFRWRNAVLKKDEKKENATMQGGMLLGDYLNRARSLIEKHKNGQEPNNLNEKSKIDTTDQKFIVYLTHDVTIMSLLNLLGLTNEEAVPQAGCFIMEVYIKEEEPHVQFLFYNKGKYTTYETSFCEKKTECKFKEFDEANRKYALTRKELDKRCK